MSSRHVAIFVVASLWYMFHLHVCIFRFVQTTVDLHHRFLAPEPCCPKFYVGCDEVTFKYEFEPDIDMKLWIDDVIIMAFWSVDSSLHKFISSVIWGSSPYGLTIILMGIFFFKFWERGDLIFMLRYCVIYLEIFSLVVKWHSLAK